MFSAPQNWIDYEEQFKQSLGGLYFQSDAGLCLDLSNAVLWASPGFEQIFGVRKLAAIGQTPSELIKVAGLDEWVQHSAANILNRASQLEGAAQDSFLAQSYVYASGAVVEAQSVSGDRKKIIITLAPFKIEKALYFGLFFNNRTEAAFSLTAPAASSDPWVQRGYWIMALWKTNKLAFSLILAAGLTGIGLWKIDAIAKLSEPFLKPAPGGRKVAIAPQRTEELRSLLGKMRANLPHSDLVRVFVGIYEDRGDQLFIEIPSGVESSSISDIPPGEYKVTLDEIAMGRFKLHRMGQCYQVEDATKLQESALKSYFIRSFVSAHVSCGIQLNPKTSKSPHAAYVGIEFLSPGADIKAAREMVEYWVPQIQDLLNKG